MDNTNEPSYAARKENLRQAMLNHNLNTVVALIGSELHWPDRQIISNLRFIFEAAKMDNLNLLEPPSNFHDWLRVPLSRTRRGTPAKPNTVNARTATLSRLYNLLMDYEIIIINPLRRLERAPNERGIEVLPTVEAIEEFISAAKSNSMLYVAARLIYHHAFQISDLLLLKWSAFYYDDGALLRRRTICKLDDASYQALDALLAKEGGPLNKHRIKHQAIINYPDASSLRSAFFQCCRDAHVRFIALSILRKASLRDFTFTPEQAGYTTQKALDYAIEGALIADGTEISAGEEGPE